MKWKDNYSIGIPEIDEEHNLILACITQLEQAKDQQQRSIALYFTLHELEDYVRLHFAVEEVIMRLFDYPSMEAHVRAHRGFAKRVKSIKDASVQRDTHGEITAFLQDWIVSHIMTADKQYAAFLFRPAGKNQFAKDMPT